MAKAVPGISDFYQDNSNLFIPLIKRPQYPGAHSGQVALPGGKVEPNETFQEALSREIHEELNIDINIHEKLAEEKYKDSEINIVLHYFLCSIKDGTIKLNEHEAISWVDKKDFGKYDFVEGDGNITSLI